ncbi:hypothetical protein I3252_11320 [Psychrobacter sp. Ps4]|uniref:hypothetical protein n=1 Tax=Psychrobacter sp. Ps4 TaxID=2790958 RepID=UPI001EDD313F|nr:hypothetical protein [Psychrobacter sp. Ps4]MCG3810068.1 hypothetical protein [Psychrobacter sp. Ps4]
MVSKSKNIKILHEVIECSGQFKNLIHRPYIDNEQVKYFDGISDTFGWHLYDIAKDKELCVKAISNELIKLRTSIFTLFSELYPSIDNDTELLSEIKSQLINEHFKCLGLAAKQLTFTAILLAFTEIYLSFNQQDIFMKYLLSSSNALGIVLANHSYVSYDELEKHKSTPIQKGKENLKSKVIPLANKIWIEEDISNLLMPSHVAHLVKRILGTNRADETIIRWFKEEDIIPNAIQEMMNSKSYPKGGNAREHRKKLESAIYEKLKPVSEKTDN